MAKKPTTQSDITSTTASVCTESKKRQLIGMLGRVGGATIAEISAALGWQPHTTRAAITGLRKSGHVVETAKPGDGISGLIYRIALSDGADAKAYSSSEAGR